MFPLLVIFGIVGGVAYYLTRSDQDYTAPVKAPPTTQPKPTPVPPPSGQPKLPTLPDNMFVVMSISDENVKSGLALQQAGLKEGIVLVVYRPGEGAKVTEETKAAAQTFPSVTFLVYPESVAGAIDPQAKVQSSCGVGDGVVVNAFPTLLGQGSPTFGPQPPGLPKCVAIAAPSAAVRAALWLAAQSVL